MQSKKQTRTPDASSVNPFEHNARAIMERALCLIEPTSNAAGRRVHFTSS